MKISIASFCVRLVSDFENWCAHVKKVDEGFLRPSVHVDDTLLTCPERKYRTWSENQLEIYFSHVACSNILSWDGYIEA